MSGCFVPKWNSSRVYDLRSVRLEEAEGIESIDGDVEQSYLLAGSSCVAGRIWESRARWRVSPMLSLMDTGRNTMISQGSRTSTGLVTYSPPDCDNKCPTSTDTSLALIIMYVLKDGGGLRGLQTVQGSR